MDPEAVPYARRVTSTAAGPKSGRERNDHTPFGSTGETLGRGQTLVTRKGLAVGVREDLSFGVCPSSSQPAGPINAR